jgi:coenzyme F420-reducing hydrogenase delta subunit/ferredoxin
MFEPKIVGFLCNWCSYTGADTAGIARLKYPANLRAVRVPCSGRVSPELILRAFDQGADGVLVLGCHIGECHYDNGNHRTAKRLPILQALLAFAGLEPERLRLDWVSASEGERFARIVNEFTEVVRSLGPVRWRFIESREQRIESRDRRFESRDHFPQLSTLDSQFSLDYTRALRETARNLLESSQVQCVIGYEKGTHGRTRPAFIYHPAEVERLVWDGGCTHNLTTYLREKLHQKPTAVNGQQSSVPQPRLAVVVKPCDSRAINVLLAEHQFTRDQVHVIGVVCPGVEQVLSDQYSVFSGRSSSVHRPSSSLQPRCLACTERVPVVYDTLIGDASQFATPNSPSSSLNDKIASLHAATPAERMEFWLSQFDRCLRCYACRQACPLCNCPTCLYERDDSLWVGMGIGVDEKRTFHLGRAYHLAGRCIGCDECERVCPVDIPISLINRMLAQEVERSFGHRAGYAVAPTPFVTVLAGEEARS